MSMLNINGGQVEGKMTVNQEIDEKDPNLIHIVGALATKEYFEEINKIESERLLVKGITVYKESFGTEDDEIVYHFVAEKLTVKPIE